jgi:hypothetical protein
MDFAEIDPVAIYAAIVSTVALGWQILKERRARRPQVEVKVSYALLGYPVASRPRRRRSRRVTAATTPSG